MTDVYTQFTPAAKDAATALSADVRRPTSIVSTGFATAIKAKDIDQLTLRIEAAAKVLRKQARGS